MASRRRRTFHIIQKHQCPYWNNISGDGNDCTSCKYKFRLIKECDEKYVLKYMLLTFLFLFCCQVSYLLQIYLLRWVTGMSTVQTTTHAYIIVAAAGPLLSLHRIISDISNSWFNSKTIIFNNCTHIHGLICDSIFFFFKLHPHFNF